MKIRDATLSDFPALIEGGSAFWNTTPYARAGFKYNPEAIYNLLEGMLDHHYLIVTVEGALITGFLGIWIAPFMFNPDYTQGTELFFYVHPAHRGQGLGKALHLQAEVELGEEVDVLAFGSLSTSTDMEKYYTDTGFEITERIYTKVL